MRIIWFSLLIFLQINLFSQELTNNQIYYFIAPVYNFKESILSITFDDGTPVQFIKAVPLLNERNIPATFYIVTYALQDSGFRNLVNSAYLAHHEIGSHTVNHYNLTKLDSTSIEIELLQSQKSINAMFGKKYCQTFAYPFGIYNDSVVQITKKYYLAARSLIGGINLLDSLHRYELRNMSF